MKVHRLARTFMRILASLAVLGTFFILDWFPTVKELSRLRSERGNLERKLKDYVFTVSSFVFPDREEKELLQRCAGVPSRELAQMEDDGAWSRSLSLWLRRQAEEDKIAGARFLFSALPGGSIEPGLRLTDRDAGADWLAVQLSGIQKGVLAASSVRFPWKGIFFNPAIPLSKPLAGRLLAITLTAPLPALLNFVNHISWGEFRLEIVRLHLEPGPVLYRGWMICRSSYLVHKSSAWVVKVDPGNGNEGLLIDPDSPLLWQPVNPSSAFREEKQELNPDSDWYLE